MLTSRQASIAAPARAASGWWIELLDCDANFSTRSTAQQFYRALPAQQIVSDNSDGGVSNSGRACDYILRIWSNCATSPEAAITRPAPVVSKKNALISPSSPATMWLNRSTIQTAPTKHQNYTRQSRNLETGTPAASS